MRYDATYHISQQQVWCMDIGAKTTWPETNSFEVFPPQKSFKSLTLQMQCDIKTTDLGIPQ